MPNPSMGMKLVVFAAGMGSRFGAVKQVVPVGPSGESILEYSLYDALAAGFSGVVFVIRSQLESAFRGAVLSRLPKDLEVSLAFQENESFVPPGFAHLAAARSRPWGTGHALLCARDAVLAGASRSPSDARFAVINADDYYGRNAFSGVARFLQTGQRGVPGCFCMAGYRLRATASAYGPVSRGICRTAADGSLLGIEEHTRILAASGGPAGSGARTGAAAPQGEGYHSLAQDGSVLARFTGEEQVSMNLWGFDASIFGTAERLFHDFLRNLEHTPDPDAPDAGTRREFYLPSVVAGAIGSGAGHVSLLPVGDAFFGLTHPADLPEARLRVAELCKEGRYPTPLWNHGAPGGPQ